MLLHILLATAELILVVCDNAEIVRTIPHHVDHIQATYPRQLSYRTRPTQHDAKTFRQIRQILQNNYKAHADRKHRLFPSERNTPFFRRPIIMLNSRKDGGPHAHRLSLGVKSGRNIKSWPSKTINDSHARKEIHSNHVHFKENARKVKLDNNLKVALNNSKAVKNKNNSKKAAPEKETLDRSFIYSALTKGKQHSVSPKFIIKQAGPSQEFGWIGHGTYAPLDVPNIFKAAGVDTHWNPEKDAIFETGLIYPALTPKIVIDKATQDDKQSSTSTPLVSTSLHSSKIISPVSVTEKVIVDQQNDPIDLYSVESIPVPRFEKSVPSTSYANKGKKVNEQKKKTFDNLMDEIPAVAPPFESPTRLNRPVQSNLSVPVSTVFIQNHPVTSQDYPAPAPKYEAIGTEYVSLGTTSSSIDTENFPLLSKDSSAPAPVNTVSTPRYEAINSEYPALVPEYLEIAPEFQAHGPAYPVSGAEYPALAPDYAQDLTHLHWAFAQVPGEDQTLSQNILPKSTEDSTSQDPKYIIPFPVYTDSPHITLNQIIPSTDHETFNEIDNAPDNEEDSADNNDHENVSDKFSSPVSGLSLPAVATKLISDITESRATLQTAVTTLKPQTSFQQPIVDFSDINIFENLEKSIPSFINIGNEESNNIDETADSDNEEEDIFLVFSEDIPVAEDDKSGASLQRVIQDNIDFFSKDEIRYSANDPEEEVLEGPKFSIVEESEERQPIFFDIPIQDVDFSTEKQLPAEIRTIFVSPENAFNIPDRYFNLGTSKYKQGDYNKIPALQPSSKKSIYDSPISSYDAPIAPSRQEDNYGDFFSGEDSRDAFASPSGEKFLRRIRKTKLKKKVSRNLKPVKKEYKTAEPVRKVFSGIKARIPFGTRLGPKTPYTPLTL